MDMRVAAQALSIDYLVAGAQTIYFAGSVAQFNAGSETLEKSRLTDG
jgi:hypothetical protein